MKKLSLSLLLSLTIALASQAQEIWLEAGLKGGGGVSFLLDKNIIDDPDYRYKFTPMYGFGAKMAVNFGPWHGIIVEGLYNFSGQDLNYQLPGTSTDLLNEIQWNSIDAYLMYRYITNRVYVELGPKYSFISKVEQTNAGLSLENASDYYEKGNIGGAFGFGGYIGGAETFSVGLGVRLNYGFTDFVNDEGKKLSLPTGEAFETDETTHPVFAQFLVEFNFGIGHWARTSCSKRMKFFGAGR